MLLVALVWMLFTVFSLTLYFGIDAIITWYENEQYLEQARMRYSQHITETHKRVLGWR